MSRELRLTPASAIAARNVKWLKVELVPLGKLTVIAGAGGLGKSQWTIGLAAEVSRGETDGDLLGLRADVLIASAEDDPSDTIKPRLMAAGAECDGVHLLDVREVGPNGELINGTVSLPGDVPAIRQAIDAADAALVIIDPIVAFFDGEFSAYREQDVRAALTPLAKAAEETGAAVLAVMHLNKAEGTDPLRRIGNSAAFTNLARSVLIFGPDPEDPEGARGSGRVLTCAKGNVRGAGRGGLRYRIVDATVVGADEAVTTSRLELIGDSDISAEDLLSDAPERGAKGEAMRFLRELLADGPLPAKRVYEEAKTEDIAEKTLKRAKAALGVKSRKVVDDGWVWSLPETKKGATRPVPVDPVDPVGPLPAIKGASEWPSSVFEGPLDPVKGKGAKKAKGAGAGVGGIRAEVGVDPAWLMSELVREFDATEIVPARLRPQCCHVAHRGTHYRAVDGGPVRCGACEPPDARSIRVFDGKLGRPGGARRDEQFVAVALLDGAAPEQGGRS